MRMRKLMVDKDKAIFIGISAITLIGLFIILCILIAGLTISIYWSMMEPKIWGFYISAIVLCVIYIVITIVAMIKEISKK